MGVRAFRDDVAAARVQDLGNITDVGRGDGDGEVAFKYTHDDLLQPLLIRLIGDADDYPKNSTFLVVTDSEDAPRNVLDAIERLSGSTTGKTVVQILALVAQVISSALNSPASEEEDSVMTDNEALEYDGTVDYEDVDEDFEIVIDDDDYDDILDDVPRGSGPSTSARNITHKPLSSAAKRRLLEDVLKAQAAGYRCSFVAGTKMDEIGSILALSRRVKLLGLPEETLEAWDLKSSDYIVLLIRWTQGYPTAAEYVARPASLEFLLGRCSSHQPSAASAKMAFQIKNNTNTSNSGHEIAASQPGPDANSSDFSVIYISNSLERYMSMDFGPLLKLRLSEKLPWDAAEDRYRIMVDAGPLAEAMPPAPTKLENNVGTETIAVDSLASQLNVAGLDDESPSVPYLAMNFALMHLVNCTSACMVCQRKVEHSFEAVKPYVCDRPLCEFQYMQLGFGPSIEHEIISQPYVVDLLISFCYAALVDHETRGIPKSLQVTVPLLPRECISLGMGLFSTQRTVTPAAIEVFGAAAEPPKSPLPEINAHKVKYYIEENSVTFHGGAATPFMRDGDLFLLVSPPCGNISSQQGRHIYFCRTVKQVGTQMSLQLLNSQSMAYMWVEPPPGTVSPTGIIEADLLCYEHNLLDLEPESQIPAMLLVLMSLPPVLAMREYLLKNPGRRLESWDLMTKPGLSLLRWIVASNRSHIVQIDKPKEVHGSDDSAAVKTGEKVWGVDESWIQFRFAQGSPSREQRFYEARAEMVGKHEHPTIFAWHGSPLKNWHSIIREGLTFSMTHIPHGRAYGHGVYFAKEFNTSLGYSGGQRRDWRFWPGSQLRAQSALSLCEIINKPDSFVSQHPYYVVGETDWIQCRYLFVRMAEPPKDSPEATQPEELKLPKKPTNVLYLEQHPSRPAHGPNGGPVQIPMSALPRSLRTNPGREGSSAASPIIVDDTSDEGSDDDFSFLLAKDERAGLESRNGLRSPSLETIVAMEHERPPSPAQYTLDTAKTSFRPGQLDISSLPKLPPPTWADNLGLRRMNKEMGSMQKTQSQTPLHELGWYVDFENMANMFQWMVELHSFDATLPLARDMERHGIRSVVLEVRFGRQYPVSPPFVRVVRPRFLPFLEGGGGHVTAGGAICMELLTNSGWSPANSMESVLLQVRMALCSTEPHPARLKMPNADYGISEALDAYRRAAMAHGWALPPDLVETAGAVWSAEATAAAGVPI